MQYRTIIRDYAVLLVAKKEDSGFSLHFACPSFLHYNCFLSVVRETKRDELQNEKTRRVLSLMMVR
jgi:hypothetical protein